MEITRRVFLKLFGAALAAVGCSRLPIATKSSIEIGNEVVFALAFPIVFVEFPRDVIPPPPPPRFTYLPIVRS